MKQLIQMIAFNLFGLDALQIIVSICSAVMLLQMVVNVISGSQKRYEIRKRSKDMENNMWAIE